MAAVNGERRTFQLAESTWICKTEGGYGYVGPKNQGITRITCLTRSPTSSLHREFDFSIPLQVIDVECDGALCTEESPVVNGDYGDVSGYRSAGLVLRSFPDGSRGQVPATGRLNRLALCVWHDEGRVGPLRSERYVCLSPNK